MSQNAPAPSVADDAPIDKMSFEQALASLERIVGQLESGRVDLEQSIALYERGAKLRAHCADKLKAAEMRVEQIVADQNGAATGTAPLDVEKSA
ncbi:MAG: exodeoxyribonuclease VII small subunit [Pseudomonadota bacterium]